MTTLVLQRFSRSNQLARQGGQTISPGQERCKKVPSSGVDVVASCGYILIMKKKRLKYQSAPPEDLTLHEDTETAEPETVVNVRSAKDRLSSLLEQASQGNEVVITSGGVPKARLVPARQPHRPFRVDWKLLRSIKSNPESLRSEELVRRDRDSRP